MTAPVGSLALLDYGSLAGYSEKGYHCCRQERLTALSMMNTVLYSYIWVQTGETIWRYCIYGRREIDAPSVVRDGIDDEKIAYCNKPIT